MRRWIAIAWHASFLVLAAGLYFFFVLPRWFELTGAWPVGLGTPMRIVDGVLIGLAALPVVFTFLHTRKPEFGTPQLALSIRLWSIVLHVLAGVLIVGAAVAEIWISLDSAGQWLFGIYGAAAAIAVLGALAFYLAYLAEKPPPPPKPLKAKKSTRRGRKSAADDADEVAVDEQDTDDQAVTTESDDEAADVELEPDSEVETEEEVEETAPVSESDASTSDDVISDSDTADEPDPADEADDADEPAGKLRNRRPGTKSGSRRFLRRRGGVALDE